MMRPRLCQIAGMLSRSSKPLRVFLSLALLAVGASACGDDEDSNYLNISTQMTPLGARVDVIVEQPGQRNVIVMKEAGQAARGSARVNTRTSGTMLVTVIVTTSSQDTISVGSVQLPLHSNYVYDVGISRQSAGFKSLCLGPGCNSEVKFPFRGTEAVSSDSMWVTHYGGILCKDCIY